MTPEMSAVASTTTLKTLRSSGAAIDGAVWGLGLLRAASELGRDCFGSSMVEDVTLLIKLLTTVAAHGKKQMKTASAAR